MSIDKVLEQIKKDLSQPSWGTKIAALKELGKLGNAGSPALPELISTLADPDEQIRWIATQAAGNIGGNDPALFSALKQRLTDQSPSVVVMAHAGLVRMGEQPEAHLKALINATRQGDEEALSAAQALGQLGQIGLPALAPLRELLQHASNKVRWTAQRAIDSLQEAEASAKNRPPAESEVDPLIARLQSAIVAGKETEALSAADALANLGVERVPIIDSLIAQGIGNFRDVSLAVLSRQGSAAIPSLTRLAEMAGQDQETLGRIAHILASMGPIANSVLLEQLQSRDIEIFDRAVIGLSLLRGAAILRIAIALGSNDSQVPKGAAAALIKIGREAMQDVIDRKQYFMSIGNTGAVNLADHVILKILEQK
ncbi:MAG: HEAT repeat domain-containing protein [Candidatus Aminicenantes bacterium]|nr:HEAT repeat domain-containing protein [Candidatus Aminicenantes bacterium]